MIEIPLNNSPEQNFNTIVDGVNYTVRVIYSTRADKWSIDLTYEGGSVLGIPLLPGSNLVSQYDIPILNMYIVDLINSDNNPTFESLGNSSRLFILEEGDL